MTHDERFLEFVARKRAEEEAIVKVTWRKVSPLTGGGWSGLGPKGALVYVYPPDVGTTYRYGRVQEVEAGVSHRTIEGTAQTLPEAKRRAAALLGAKT